jgi:hypothetical protein
MFQIFGGAMINILSYLYIFDALRCFCKAKANCTWAQLAVTVGAGGAMKARPLGRVMW